MHCCCMDLDHSDVLSEDSPRHFLKPIEPIGVERRYHERQRGPKGGMCVLYPTNARRLPNKIVSGIFGASYCVGWSLCLGRRVAPQLESLATQMFGLPSCRLRAYCAPRCRTWQWRQHGKGGTNGSLVSMQYLV